MTGHVVKDDHVILDCQHTSFAREGLTDDTISQHWLTDDTISYPPCLPLTLSLVLTRLLRSPTAKSK